LERKIVSGIMIVMLLIGSLTLAFNIQLVRAELKSFSDDFSTDTVMWEYLGSAWPPYWGEGAEYSAYRDTAEEYVVLTPNDPHLAGVLWFKWTFTSPFTVNFRYLAGDGSGADGLVMMFYKEKPPVIASGGNLSFFGSGYGVEFDNWYNAEFEQSGLGNEPSANHIAIIKDGAYNHLIYANDSRTEDNIWHNVTVSVDYSSIIVHVDLDKVIHWNGTIDRAFGGFGFAGTTGAFTNWHLIDDFSITIRAWTVDDDGPADFSSIQEAIDAASPGDIIFVHNGAYYEHVVVNKSISLVGENKSDTIIDGSGIENVVVITADNVFISGFTVQNSGKHVNETGSYSPWFGIVAAGSTGLRPVVNNVRLENLLIFNNEVGIWLIAIDSIVTRNTLLNNIHGVVLFGCERVEVERNVVSENGVGVNVFASCNNTIKGNNISENEIGVCLDGYEETGNPELSGQNIVVNNVISNNSQQGIYIEYSSQNILYHNNFIENTMQALNVNGLPNAWDNGFEGNYWGDYTGVDLFSGPFQNETGGDGIGDTPYVIDKNNQDNYPLMNPYVPLFGDLNYDGKVDIDDIVEAALAFGSYPGHPRWNPIADVNQDDHVDIDDLILIAMNFGKSYL
jgi:parallel beta-helix repeat protein